MNTTAHYMETNTLYNVTDPWSIMGRATGLPWWHWLCI